MALDLQLTTGNAEAALKRVEGAITAFQAKLENLKNTKVEVDLSGIKVPTNVSGLKELSSGLNALSKIDAARIDAASKALERLAGINLTGTAAGLKAVAGSLREIKTPRNLERTATNIGNIGLAARSSIANVNSFKTALNGITPPGGLGRLPPQFNQAGQAARSAAGGVSAFNSVLGALGITAGAAGLKQFVDSALEASTTITQFGNRIEAAIGDVPDAANQVANSLGFVRNMASQLALPLESSMHAFSKLAGSMLAAGNTMEDVQNVALGFGKGFRAMGLTAAQTDRAFNAINQTFAKGTVSMEELRQQLGEVFPAFQELARSTGMSTEELIKQIAAGKVSSQTFLKLADDIGNKFGPAAEKAAQSGQAAMIRFGNAVFELKARFGDGFFDGIAGGLNKLTEALNTQGVRDFAQTVGTVLGTALGLASQALSFVTSNSYAMGIAMTALGGIATSVFLGMASRILGMIPGLGLLRMGIVAIGGALMQLTMGIFGLSSAAGIFGTLGAAIRTAAIAVAPFAGGVAALVLGVTALSAVTVVLGSALGALIQWLTQGGSFSEHFANNLNFAKSKAFELAGGIYESVKGFLGFGGAASEAATAATQSAEGIGAAGEASDTASTELTKLVTPAVGSADALSEVGTNSSTAAGGVEKLAGSGASASGAMSSLAGNLSSAATQARSAASAFDQAAAAANRLAAAKARANSSGGGNTQTSSFAGGGISDGPAKLKTTVPVSAFAGAPHLSGGIANTDAFSPSLPGGGIPAVLHPNEAVVPLAGGGSIPISVSGGGSSGQPQTQGPQIGTILMMQYTMLSDIKIEVTRTWEAVDQLITTVRSEWTRGHTELQTIASRLYELDRSMTKIADSIYKIGTSGGSGGSYGGGGIGGSGDALADDFKAAKRAIALNNAGYKNIPQGGGIGYRGSDGKFYASYEMSPDYETNKGIDAQNANIRQELVDKYGADKVRAYSLSQMTSDQRRASLFSEQFSANQGNNKTPFFSKGSPNASQDLDGGFNAVLHKDEAVIPLPDGRSVPVSFPKGFMDGEPDRTTDDRRAQRARGNGDTSSDGGGRNIYNITMNIQTADANSFRRSEGQMINELRTKLDRSKVRNGPTRPGIDDPTKRVT